MSNDFVSIDIIAGYANKLISMSEQEEIVWYLAQQVIGKLGFEDVVIYLADDDQQLHQVAAGDNKTDFSRQIILNPLTLKVGEGIVGKAAAKKAPQLIGDTRKFQDYIVDDDIRLSELAVPMIAGQELIGVIDSEHHQANFFSDYHVKLLTILASLTANKLVQAKTHRALQQSFEKLEYNSKIQNILFEIAELIFSTDSLRSFFKKLHIILGQLTFTKNFIVALRFAQSDYFVIPFASDEKDAIPENTKVDIVNNKKTLTTHVLLSKKPLLLNKADIKAFVVENDINVIGSWPNSWLGIPFGDKTVDGAVIVQCYDDSYWFEQRDMQLLNYVAKHIHNAIERMQAKTQLEFLALHDPLTGVANRTLFKSQLEKSIANCKRDENLNYYLLYIDLDGFKLINDKFGHQVGDILLQKLAKRMQENVREADTICRQGGDEFAILINHNTNQVEGYIEDLTNRILTAFNLPVEVSGREISVTASIGVVSKQNSEADIDKVLACADEAMYVAKSLGKNQVFFYDNTSIDHFIYSYAFTEHFDQAIARKDFKLYSQTIRDTQTNIITGQEVLIRWFHPELGLIMPNKFIDHITSNGLIEKLDMYVLEEAITLLKGYKSQLSDGFSLNINVSPKSFISEYFIERMTKFTRSYPDLVRRLCIEITEQSLAEQVEATQRNIKVLQSLGVKVALDDFGTGYSSLNYLHKYDVDILKIDRSFISTYSQGSASATVFESIINLAKSLNIKVVAEGVETKEQLAMLKGLNCDKVQGYYFDKPQPINLAIGTS